MYVDAFFQRDADIIKVVERSNEGKRIFKEFPVRYTFYYPDPRGKYQSIYGETTASVNEKYQIRTMEFLELFYSSFNKEVFLVFWNIYYL